MYIYRYTRGGRGFIQGSFAQDMAAPVLTISFSTSDSRVEVEDCFFFERHSAAINPINSRPPSPNPRPRPSASESFDDFFFFLEPPPPPSAGAALGPGPHSSVPYC